ncbi:MutS-related protein [Burkholderia ambifaria]|uniref:MutS-related protein n=1 Tax=Burkholderia ambifaria TaxID=152480 RepID=UPI00158DC82E|nr:DNA mismatch repair protein MutS [Burkholderia ambifaria]
MKAYLLYSNRDFDMRREPLWNEDTVTQDLSLETLYQAMARGDAFLYNVAKQVVPVSSINLDDIRFRQAVLADCIDHEEAVRHLYAIAVEALETERHTFHFIFASTPGMVLHGARELVQAFLGVLHKLRAATDSSASTFRSEGFRRFFATIEHELNDDYFRQIERCLKELRFRNGTLISARLGDGNKGVFHVLRKPHEPEPSFVRRLFARRAPALTFRIADRDEAGARALSELEARGTRLVANALAQSADHIQSFFSMLRAELAFYIGCLNLRHELERCCVPTCFPVAHPAGERMHAMVGLCDASLALRLAAAPVGNDVQADGKTLVVVTGANEGGKSTFLRAVGLAQLMMQAGMFVTATSFSANVCDRVFTHYKREEDATMQGGKLDEELRRMSQIVDHLRENALFLSNESFAATNEREGAEIAQQIVSALMRRRVKMVLVTHLYALADELHAQQNPAMLFLRADRRADGVRTFKLVEGPPLRTSFGEDLYRQIFVEPASAVNASVEPAIAQQLSSGSD